MFELRPYRQSDEEPVAALWREVLADSAPHNDPAVSIPRKLAVDDGLFLVATLEDAPLEDAPLEDAPLEDAVVGTAVGGYDGCRGWVYSVAVKPAFQRRGIATALLRRLEEALAERGCLKVNLQVRETNRGVVAFYEKLGYGVEARVSMGKRLYDPGGEH